MNIIITFLFFLSLVSCAMFQRGSFKEREYHKVTKLDSINNYYLIYTIKGDSIFKIVSEKNYVDNCKKIEVGKSYPLELISMRSSAPSIGGLKISPVNYLDVRCFQFNENTQICKEDGIDELYFAKDLKGLCIQYN